MNFSEYGEIPLCPVHYDIVRPVAEGDVRFAGLFAVGVVADCNDLDPVAVSDLCGEAITVDVAIERVRRIGDIHVVNHTLNAVGKGKSWQNFGFIICAAIDIAIMHGKVIRAVMSGAGARQSRNALFIYGKLRLKTAVFGNVSGAIVGNGMSTAPIAVCIIVIRKNV